MTVGELLDRMTAVEMVEWRIIEGIDPFGERRADWRAAITVAKLLQVQGANTTAADILKDLIDVFEQAPSTIDGDAARQAKMESSAMAWASVFKQSSK